MTPPSRTALRPPLFSPHALAEAVDRGVRRAAPDIERHTAAVIWHILRDRD